MVRNKIRTTNIGLTNANKMRIAVLRVVNENSTVRSISADLYINRTTIQRYVNKWISSTLEERESFRFTPNYGVNKVMDTNLKNQLKEYIIVISRMHHGLTRKQVMAFAYKLAVANKLKIPCSRIVAKSAGFDWFYEFKKRHPKLSVRKPEGTSLSRATTFNKTNVDLFFNNLNEVYLQFKNDLTTSVIYNLDKIALTTVHNPPKVVAKKGVKQVGQVILGERGVLVTACCIVCANGSAVPPCLVFPRVKFKDHMLIGGPAGTAGFASKTGWMNGDIFLDFQKNVRATLVYIHYS